VRRGCAWRARQGHGPQGDVLVDTARPSRSPTGGVAKRSGRMGARRCDHDPCAWSVGAPVLARRRRLWRTECTQRANGHECHSAPPKQGQAPMIDHRHTHGRARAH